MLLPEIDEKKTRNNVIELFEQYDSLCRLAGEQYEQKLTEEYDYQKLQPQTFADYMVALNISYEQERARINGGV